MALRRLLFSFLFLISVSIYPGQPILSAPNIPYSGCVSDVQVVGALTGVGRAFLKNQQVLILTDSHLLAGRTEATIRVPDATGKIGILAPAIPARVVTDRPLA